MPPNSKRGEVKYRCTACSAHIKTSFEAFLHPLLKVLVCRKCHTDYGTGDFTQLNDSDVGPGVDENGDDNYCRWCVDGGDLFACGNDDLPNADRCHYAFCTECIKRNCPDEAVLNQENFPPGSDYKWMCFACEPEKLKKHRQEAQDIILNLSSRDLKRPANKDEDRDRDSMFGVDDVQTAKKRKTDNTNGTKESAKEPVSRSLESTSMPPVAPPKPPESALRRLSKKSATPEPKKTTVTTPASSSSAGSNTPTSAPPKPISKLQSTLPSSVNNPPKIRLPPTPSTMAQQDASRTNGTGLKSRPLSKQLKATNEQIRPSCKVPLSDIELKKRLENFSQVKQNCISEIGSKFQNIIEMFQSKDLIQGKSILKYEIEDLEKPIQEFTTMLRDLKSLYHSQI